MNPPRHEAERAVIEAARALCLHGGAARLADMATNLVNKPKETA